VCDASTVVVARAATKSTGRSFQGMAPAALDKIPLGPKLDALTAEKVFGWKNVHQHDGALVGKKQDKAGRWRLGRVPLIRPIIYTIHLGVRMITLRERRCYGR